MLTNPINNANLVNRFAQYVQATANSGISWGTNAVPFAEFSTAYFGGTTAGAGLSISGPSVGATGTPVTASTIFNVLVAETQLFTNIRLLRARRNVTGIGTTYDQTAVAHMNVNYRQALGAAAAPGIASGQTITSSGLETFFNNLRTAYTNARNTVVQIDINLCHSSCHGSCHGSRSRR